MTEHPTDEGPDREPLHPQPAAQRPRRTRSAPRG